MPLELRHSGPIRHKAASEMTDQELMDRILELAPEVGLAPMKTIEAVEERFGASVVSTTGPA